MISHGKDIKIFCGNANQPLAEEICRMMGTKLGEAEVKSFADGEVSVSLYETVRGSDVFVVQSTCKPVNDNLMELLVMIDALRRASAGRITAVIPYFGYARQDRKAKARDPISAKLVANMITAAGADRVLTMDLHASQIQGFFDIPVDNLLGNPIFVDYYAKKFGDKCEDMIVVSPDVGSVARARAFAQKLHMQMAIVDKRRQKANQCEVMNVIGHRGSGRRQQGLRLRQPRCPLRPRHRPPGGQQHRGAGPAGHHSRPCRGGPCPDQVPDRCHHVLRGYRAHLSGGLHLQAVPLRTGPLTAHCIHKAGKQTCFPALHLPVGHRKIPPSGREGCARETSGIPRRFHQHFSRAKGVSPC